MRRTLLTPLLALGLLLAAVAPAAAITGGQPDGEGHPYSALLLIPELGLCSGTLIDEDVILTAGHCTYAFEELGETVYVSFDAQAEVDETWAPVNPEDWYTASTWVTHPEYVHEDWPFTPDYGLLFLDEPTDITPAELPEPYLLEELIGENGQTAARFEDVGYGQNGNVLGGGPPIGQFTWERKVAIQRWAPGKGGPSAVLDETWFILNNVPSSKHGSACGGDSGSGVFPYGTDTVLAVHTGGYNLGWEGQICGRISSLNHRVDLPEILTWIEGYLD